MNNFGVPPVELVSGQGAVVTDADGKQYLDLLGGIAVNALGHAHPAMVAGGLRAGRHPRPRVQLLHPPDGARARRAAAGHQRRATSDGRVIFCNSGAEANEAAFKMARLTGRPRIIAARGRLPRPHHGRAGADRPTGQAGAVRADAGRRGIRSLRRHRGAAGRRGRHRRRGVPGADHGRGRGGPGARRLPGRGPGDHRRTRRAAGASTRCRPASAAPGPGSRHQQAGIVPDVITLAKGLGGGLPIGAAIGIGRRRDAAAARPARLDLRRQPGLRGGRAGRAAHHRDRRPARPCRCPRQAHRHRASRISATR